MSARYDQLGQGYATRRRPDPRIASQIDAALGDARLQRELDSGEWQARYASLLDREAMDFGYRLLTAGA